MKLRVILFAVMALIVMFQFQNCGSVNSSNGTTAGVTGASGYTYSVALTPNTTTPTQGSTSVSGSITVTVSTAEYLTINTGYYNSSGSKIQMCSQPAYQSTSVTFTCTYGTFGSSGTEYLYVDVYDSSSGQLELACDGSTTSSGCSGTYALSVQSSSSSSASSYMINAGGGSYTNSSGQYWYADQYYGGTSRVYTVSHSISNTSDQQVYQSQRELDYFYYTFPISNGTHTVTLKFAELYWSSAGSRIFDVSINGSQVLTNFDPFAAAGGKYIAVDETFSVNVTNGYLTVTFQSVKDHAQINGIVIN